MSFALHRDVVKSKKEASATVHTSLALRKFFRNLSTSMSPFNWVVGDGVSKPGARNAGMF